MCLVYVRMSIDITLPTQALLHGIYKSRFPASGSIQ